jgi:molecular chaperone DnaJ
MATAKRDYYEVLGVARDADERAIKKAFRALARELHPDVSDDPGSEERFREVAEAYEVLSKAETRELYDRYGHEGLRTGGFRPTDFDLGSLSDLLSAFFGDDVFGGMTGARRGRRRGGDLLAEVEIELVEAARGAVRSVPLSVAATCDACGGSGAEPGTEPETCPQCGGAGRLQQVSNTVFGQFVRAQVCPRCHGGGTIVTHLCKACGGAGQVAEERALQVKIPAGIHDGQRIRLSGEGHAGTPGGPAGDVYVQVRVRSDPRFVREGNDVISTVDMTMTQAALGARLTIPTLDGEAEIELGPGTQPGEIRILRGKGMPVLQGFGRGDHRVLVNVLVPRRLTEEQRRALEEFERTADESTYGSGDEGLFGRIRAAFR